MFNLKPELRENETVIGEYPATVYLSPKSVPRGSNVRLWLTNQRLILKAGLGGQRALPLYALVDAREEKASWVDVARLEFANGHVEWWSVSHQAEFLSALRAAQLLAPQIPEEAAPVSPSSSTSAALPALFGGTVAVIAVIGLCVFMSFCVLIALMGGLAYFVVNRAPAEYPPVWTPASLATPAPGQTGGLGERVVTLDEQGQTIYMTIGGSFLLQLGEQYDWTVNVSDQSVLSRVPNILVVRGAQGVYTAHQAGTVTLTATGDPPCRKSTPACMQPSRLFTVTIEISK